MNETRERKKKIWYEICKFCMIDDLCVQCIYETRI